jgi:cytochrome P450
VTEDILACFCSGSAISSTQSSLPRLRPLGLPLELHRKQLVSESVATRQQEKTKEQQGLQEQVQPGMPPGPAGPGVWQQIRWILDPFDYMRRAAIRYGDCFTARLGEGASPIVFCSDPRSLETLLANDDASLFDAPGDLNGLFEPFLGTESVVGISGDRHRRMRKLLLPPFHGERMRAYGDAIIQITREVMREWQVGQRISAQTAMQSITMRVILRTVFGLAEGERFQCLETQLARMLNEMGNPLSVSLLYFPFLRLDLGPASPWGRFLRRRAEIDAMIFAEIEERRHAPDPSREDILSLLMSARDEEGAPLTDRELRDELMTLLVAGHETTATALTWALYWIHRLPEVRSTLLEEFSVEAGASDPATVARLPYLNAVCSETLRIYPVGMLTFPRVANRSVEMGSYQIQPSTIVLGSIYLAHRRPEVYPDPESFRPQRFIERSFSPYEYLPFGGGSRRCIGMAFAQYEMRLVLHTLLSSACLELADNRAAHPVRRGLTSGASPVELVVKEIKADPK